jgi:predicted Kef-type K+ transport protein
MRAIGPFVHGVVDYASVIVLVLAPGLAGFAGRQAMICYALAVIHLLLTLATRFPLGPMKLVGFPIHGAIELIVGVLLIALPWLAGFSAGVNSRNFFVSFGFLLLVIWVLTDYRNLRGGAKPVG